MNSVPTILVIVPAFIPSVNLGVIIPLTKLKEEKKIKLRVVTNEIFSSIFLKNVDLVVFVRSTTMLELKILNEVLLKKIRVIYEIDDNLFQIPTDSQLGMYHRDAGMIFGLKTFISNADTVRVYSDVMLDITQKFNNHSRKYKSFFDVDIVKGLKRAESKAIRIVYATSRISDDQQKIFEKALLKTAKKHGDKVEIYFWGAKISNNELSMCSNVFYLKPIYDYKKFIRKFYKYGFDIGLAPVFDSPFYNAKTNNKYREYGGCKVAGVYSNEKLYSSSIIDGENGVLVDNTEQAWFDGIECLIEDSDLRNNIVRKSHEDVRTNYTLNSICEKWCETINDVLDIDITSKSYPLEYINNFKNEVVVCVQKSDQDSFAFHRKAVSVIKTYFSSTCFTYNDLDELMYELYKRQVKKSNILIFTDDISVIDYADKILDTDNRIVILTSINYSAKTNISLINLHEMGGTLNRSLYEYFEDNIFYKIICNLSEMKLIDNRCSSLFMLIQKKLKKLRIVKLIMFLYQKKNSIRLRIVTYIEAMKINFMR